MFDFRMPSSEELYEVCSRKYQQVAPFMIDQWPASVAALSFPTKMVEFDPQRFYNLWSETDETWVIAQEVADRLDAEMGWDDYFIRLNSRSPKDVTDRPITCSGKQAVSWIMGSERCLDDVSVAANGRAPLFVCLRQPAFLYPAAEFRCFAKDGEVLAVSRYFYDRKFDEAPDAGVLMDKVRSFYTTHLAAYYPTVVFDLYAPGTSQQKLIELNPYGLSDPCLFGDYKHVEAGGVRL